MVENFFQWKREALSIRALNDVRGGLTIDCEELEDFREELTQLSVVSLSAAAANYDSNFAGLYEREYLFIERNQNRYSGVSLICWQTVV